MSKLISTWSGADGAGDKPEKPLGDGAPRGGAGGLNKPTGEGAGDVATFVVGVGAGAEAGGVATGAGAAAGGGGDGGGVLTGGGVAGGGALTGGGVAGGGALTGGGGEAEGSGEEAGGEDTDGGGELTAGGGDEVAGSGEPVGVGVVDVGGAGLVVGDVAGAWPPTPATIMQRNPIQRAFFPSIFITVYFAHKQFLRREKFSSFWAIWIKEREEEGIIYIGVCLGEE